MTVQSKSPEQIESEIRNTRRDIDRTLDALQTRLSPGQLLDQTLGYMKSGGGEFAANFGRTVTQNPIPVALLGIGCLWLMCSRPHSQAGNGQFDDMSPRAGKAWGERAADASEAAAETAGEWSEEARDRTYAAADMASGYVQGAGGAAREYAQTAGDTARRYAHRAENYAHAAWNQGARAGNAARHAIDDYPLVLGAVGLAVGALAAALLPSTRREDELMGAAADELKRRAGEVASSGAHKLQEAAESATDAATQAAADEAERQGLPGDPSNIGGARHETAPDRMEVSTGDKRAGGDLHW
jgi:hypothetical protein